MSVFTLGGALVQLPLGRISDRMDRRIIIAFVCVAAAALGVALATFGSAHRWLVLPLIGLFGLVALPLYGLSVAHTNDRIARDEFVETSATLLMINSLASVSGPTLAALAMGWFGTSALFFYTAAIHAAMAVFAIVRITMKQAASPAARERYEPLPAAIDAGRSEPRPARRRRAGRCLSLSPGCRLRPGIPAVRIGLGLRNPPTPSRRSASRCRRA